MKKKLLKDITNKVAKNMGITKDDAYKIGIDIFQEIQNEVVEGNSVMIFDFGTFKSKLTKGRDISFLTNNKKNIKDYYLPKFAFSQCFRNAVKNNLNKENFDN